MSCKLTLFLEMVMVYKVYLCCDYRFPINNLKISCLKWQCFDSIKKEATRIERMDF